MRAERHWTHPTEETRRQVLRWGLVGVGLILAGACCTVLTAWLTAWLTAQHGMRIGTWRDAELIIADGEIVGERQLAPGRRRLTSWPPRTSVPAAGVVASRSVPVREISDIPLLEPRGLWHPPSEAIVSQFAFGWPVPALAWTRRDWRGAGTSLASGVWLPAWTLVGGPVPLPTQALWAAFALDSIAWAGALALVAGAARWLPRALVRRARRRRGACEACGYDLAGAPAECPECGSRPAARGPRGRAPAD